MTHTAAIATAAARVAGLEAELAAARADLAALEAAAAAEGPALAAKEAANNFFDFVADNVWQTFRGPSGNHTGAVKGLITKRFNRLKKDTWGGDYAALRAYMVEMMGDYIYQATDEADKDQHTRARRYIVGNHLCY